MMCTPGRSVSRFLIALSCVIAASCRSESGPPDPPPAVPVFLISIDSLRADRLPAYGYAKGSTPAIDSLRRDAVLFQAAFSNSPQTLPSHASILTGTLPPVHGIRADLGYRLTAATPTLASRLRQNGYRTAGAVSTYRLRRGTGIAEGFEMYDDRFGAVASDPMGAERSGESTRTALMEFLDGFTDRRVFAFLQINEPHAPYEPPEDFRRLPDDYDNEIAAADAVLGRFLDALRARGWYDHALIILLSDHGEGLGDHGEEGHGLFVYRESIHVPLLIKLPQNKRAGETVPHPVGLNEVAGLVLNVATGEGDAGLLNPDAGTAAVYSETYYPRLHFGWAELRSLISADRHLIDAPRRELYDYRRDPDETRNLAAAEKPVAEAMLKNVRAIDNRFSAPARVTGALDARTGDRSNAVDPKDKVQIVRDLRRALSFYEARRYRDAIPLLERVVFSEPAIVEGWAMLGRSRAAAGQKLLALEAYREGLKHSPDNSDLALLAANQYAEVGRWPEAEQVALRLTANDPVLSHETLAQFALRRGRIDAAREHAEAAARLAPGRLSLLMLLAEISRRASLPAEQLMWLDRAAQETVGRGMAAPEGLQFQRGRALEALRRGGEAEAAYRAEVAQFPGNVEAWKQLTQLLAREKRIEEARSVVSEALRRNDTREMKAAAAELLRQLDQ